MEQLTDQDKKKLIDHMNQFENETWIDHAHWAWENLGIRITPNDCARLMIHSMF